MAKVTSAADWKASRQGIELELPSGNVCLVRMTGMEVFLRKGMIPNTLLPIVREAIHDGTAEKLAGLDINESTLSDMLQLFDDVVCQCVVEPKVAPTPDSEDDRQDDVLYADEVDFDDKQFIFQYVVGGTRDLEQFRSEQSQSVAAIQRGKKSPVPAKSAAGNRR